MAPLPIRDGVGANAPDSAERLTCVDVLSLIRADAVYRVNAAVLDAFVPVRVGPADEGAPLEVRIAT